MRPSDGAVDLRGRTVLASFYHAPVLGTVVYEEDALIRIDAAGVIRDTIVRSAPDHAPAMAAAEAEGALTRLDGILLPGFVDLHVHAPQYPQLGRALDRPLASWLQDYTFPLEARYADTAFAERAYRALVGDLLANGTTTTVYFATIHQEATRRLVDICIEMNQRALVGKVAMDDPASCPAFYRDASAEAGAAGTLALIDYVAAHPGNHGLVHPAITPRFLPACTDPLLDRLGGIARDCGCHVQTHCSESDWQHAHAWSRFGRSDAAVLDGFGLVTRRTVLAHAPHLSSEDADLVGARGAGIAHCPLSNAYFADAVFPLRAALAKGIRIGLGSDVAGGPSVSLLEGMRGAVLASRIMESGTDSALPPERRGRPGSRIDIKTAFHLATAGGGDVLDLPIGLFAPGHHFDAMALNVHAEAGTIRLWDGESDEDRFDVILNTASRANIAAVWVGGKRAC